MDADLLNIREKKKRSFATRNITESDITKPFLTLCLCQHICLTQLSTLVGALLGATIDFEHSQKSKSYLS
jgi:hypothetical protein